MVKRFKLSKGIEGFWSVPTSGYGHTADEQPLPYMELGGVPLTPRFGGEEAFETSNNDSLPLPYGFLRDEWPIKQKIFNLFRRRINIYWRNLFKSRCRVDKKFLFIEQMNFEAMNFGFVGESPVARFERAFQINKTSIIVHDKIVLKQKISFQEFVVLSIPTLCCEQKKKILKAHILDSFEGASSRTKKIQSSTGWADVTEMFYKQKIFRKNDVLNISYQYWLDL
jgi:hypothetical protein